MIDRLTVGRSKAQIQFIYLFPYLLSSITNDCRVFPFLLDATQVYFPRLSSEVTATRRWLCMVVTLFQDMMTTPGLSSLNMVPSFSHLMDGNGSPLAAHVKCAISSSFVCSTLSVVVWIDGPDNEIEKNRKSSRGNYKKREEILINMILLRSVYPARIIISEELE